MDRLAFIASLVDSLAWPAVFVVLLVFLRPHFGRIIELVRTVKYKELELTFGAATPEAAKLLENFWLPDGQTPDPANEAALRTWMRNNQLTSVSITTLLNAAEFDAARRQAVADLKLARADVGEGHG